MSSDNEKKLLSEFENLSTWEDKYRLIIEKGRALPSWSESDKKDDLKVKGCQSQVWLKTEFKNGRILFSADSDALIAKGLIALLIQVYSNQTPDEIIQQPLNFVKKIGLDTALSPSRANGLYAMIKQMQFYALAYRAKKETP